jgi:hypothetical protein
VTVECDQTLIPGPGSPTGIATATDNCQNFVHIGYNDLPLMGGSCPQNRIIIRTWTATDSCGNTTTCNQPITVRDSTPPMWTTVAGSLDSILECSDAAGLAAAQALFPVASDNCDNDVTNIVKVSGPFVAGTLCAQAGTYTNTWTVSDTCGNTSSIFTQVITIVDTKAPTWTTAALALDVTLECSDVAGIAAAQAQFPVAVDSCDNDVTNLVKNSVYSFPTIFARKRAPTPIPGR